MSITRLLFIILIIALITGAISTSGFLFGSGALLFINLIWPILIIVFIFSLIKLFIYPNARQNNFERNNFKNEPHIHPEDDLERK